MLSTNKWKTSTQYFIFIGDHFYIVSWIYESRCVAKVATVWASNFFVFMCVWLWFYLRNKLSSLLHYEENIVLICKHSRRRNMVDQNAINIMVMRHVILQYTIEYYAILIFYVSCLNFWDKACWFLSLRVFGLLSSSLLLFPQGFVRYVLRPSSGVCWTLTNNPTTHPTHRK